MKKVLLTGMSGTGKSTLIGELSRLGFRAVDLGEEPWSEEAPDGDWVWNEDRVAELLGSSDGKWLFTSGCAENQGQFHPQFEKIILLSAPTEVIEERLRTRTNNQYGKRPGELEEVLGYVETVEPLLRRAAHHEIDTSAPLDEVLEAVLTLVGAERANA